MLDSLSPMTEIDGRGASADYEAVPMACHGCHQPMRDHRVCPICVRPSHERCLRRTNHRAEKDGTTDARLGCLACERDAR